MRASYTQDTRTRGGQVRVCAMGDGEVTRDSELEVQESSYGGHVRGEQVVVGRPYV